MKRKTLVVVIMICICLTSCTLGENYFDRDKSTGAGKENSTIYSPTDIYNQSVKFVGEIVTYDRGGNELALGTCFVYSSDGKIITNYHVIEGAGSAKVDINGKTYRVESVLAYDTTIDLAVIKINATGLDAATISKRQVQVGDTVYAIGSSRGMTNTYSQGIVTYANRVIDGVAYVQHDASITHGNSGGPLINEYGEVIGINTWTISDSQNLNFAISTNEINTLVYNPPLSLPELTTQNLTPFQQLVDWVRNNATDVYDDRCVFYDESPSGALCGISYNYSDGESLSISSLTTSDQSTVWVALTLKEGSSLSDCAVICEWNASSEIIGEAYGKLNVATYTYGQPLAHTQYYGNSDMEPSIAHVYRTGIATNIEWLRLVLEATELDITLNELGFTAYVYP